MIKLCISSTSNLHGASAEALPKKIYKLAIIGGGPAGVGVIVRAARLGLLEQLAGSDVTNITTNTNSGVALIHSGDESTLGCGKLGSYGINSNTFGKSLVASVLDDKTDVSPPEVASGTYLEALRLHPDTTALVENGYQTAPLESLGKFLRAVGTATKTVLDFRFASTSTCKVNTKATCITKISESLLQITLEKTASDTGDVIQSEIIYAESIALATGGIQSIPTNNSRQHKSKLFKSDDVLRSTKELQKHLEERQSNKVCIVGGSHSAFSVGWLLLKHHDFQPKDITMLHRSPIRCYYAHAKDAINDGVSLDKAQAASPMPINTFTGLREDAKNLYKRIKNGNETRIRIVKSSAKIQQKAFEDAAAIIYCTGYQSNLIPIIDGLGGKEVSVANATGQANVSHEGKIRVQSSDKYLENIFGIGLGFALPAPVLEMKTETRSDGVAVYQRRGASIVLANIFELEDVYGTGNKSYEEMIEAQNTVPLSPKKKKKSKEKIVALPALVTATPLPHRRKSDQTTDTTSKLLVSGKPNRVLLTLGNIELHKESTVKKRPAALPSLCVTG